MPSFFVDPEASALVKELREARALSPEEMADEIATMARRLGAAWTRGTVDAYTIRRIEGRDDQQGRVPRLRVQFVIAQFFEVPHTDIWKPRRRVKVTA